MSLPVTFSQMWKASSPWIGEYLPGAPQYIELAHYNEMLNDPLKRVGYGDKAILFLVLDQDGRKTKIWNIYVCQPSDPTYVAPLFPLRGEDQQFEPLSDSAIARMVKKLAFWGPCFGLSDEEREKALTEVDVKLKDIRDRKARERDAAMIDLTKQVETAHVDSPLVQDELIKTKRKFSAVVKANLEKEK